MLFLPLPPSFQTTEPVVVAPRRIRGLFSVYNTKSAQYTPFFDVTITIASGSQIRIDAVPKFALNDGTHRGSFYLYDGKKQYEYNSLQNTYSIKDAPRPGERFSSQLCDMAGLRYLLPEVSQGQGQQTRTTRTETVDGVEQTVVTDREPPRKTSTSTVVGQTVFQSESATQRPRERRDEVEVDGKIQPNLKFVYTEFDTQPTIAASTWAFAVPKDATDASLAGLLPVGTLAPDFVAIGPKGESVKLSSLRGKLVILDFWATWCGPCQASMPHLASVARKVAGQNVAVLALCVWDEQPAYREWVKKNAQRFPFPTAFAPLGQKAGNIASTLYKATGIPTQYVIGKDGRILAGFIGFNGANDQRLEKALEKQGIKLAP